MIMSPTLSLVDAEFCDTLHSCGGGIIDEIPPLENSKTTSYLKNYNVDLILSFSYFNYKS